MTDPVELARELERRRVFVIATGQVRLDVSRQEYEVILTALRMLGRDDDGKVVVLPRINGRSDGRGTQ